MSVCVCVWVPRAVLIADDDETQAFCDRDRNYRVTCARSVPMVYIYFVRAGMRKEEFSSDAFKGALCLAVGCDQDLEDYKIVYRPNRVTDYVPPAGALEHLRDLRNAFADRLGRCCAHNFYINPCEIQDVRVSTA